jgi:hypothetical protein
MSNDSALVMNAADRGQVKHAARKEKDRRARDLKDLRAILASPEGRRVLWRVLCYCEVFADPSHARGDMTHQNIGKGNVGRFMISEINEADEQSYFLMMQEARVEKDRDAIESKSVQQQTGDS